jgi:hypothetical protein
MGFHLRELEAVMNETYLKKCLTRELRKRMPTAVVYRHEDAFTAGIPDISVTFLAQTSWIEVKFDRPGRQAKVTPAQALALKQLPGLLVRYQLDKDGSKTTRFEGLGLDGRYVDGFAHERVAVIIETLHRIHLPLVRAEGQNEEPGQ